MGLAVLDQPATDNRPGQLSGRAAAGADGRAERGRLGSPPVLWVCERLVPVRCPPFAVFIDFQQELGRVDRGGGAGIQQQLFVLGQVLGGRLLGQAGTVQELALQQRKISLRAGQGGLGTAD